MDVFMDAFFAIDTDCSGTITKEELEIYMNKNNYELNFVTKWLKLFDQKNTGIITLDEFCRVLGLELEEVMEKQQQHRTSIQPVPPPPIVKPKRKSVVTLSSDMEEYLQIKVIDIIWKARDHCDHEREQVKYIKQMLDNEYDKLWHCVLLTEPLTFGAQPGTMLHPNATVLRLWHMQCTAGRGSVHKWRQMATFSILNSQRHFSNSSQSSIAHVCIVGSGPAAFYTAQQLLKSGKNIRVDIFEKSPVPFGLVRYGVAPDHPEVKNVINTFTQVAKNDAFSYNGNVSIGSAVSISELQQAYHAVILAYGAAKNKSLGIPGENLVNVHAAKDFVGWYNGLPESQQLHPNLNCESAVIIGHGNVALDVARILLSPLDLLRRTDIPQSVLDLLAERKIRHVHLIGRRGPLQVAFTIKELREQIHLPNVRTKLHVPLDSQEENWPNVILPPMDTLPRPRRRLTELLVKTWQEQSTPQATLSVDAKECHLHFLKSPVQFSSSSTSNQNSQPSVSGVDLIWNELKGPLSEVQSVMPRADKAEHIPCGLAVYSIGYSAQQIDPAIPFDQKRSIVPNVQGRVVQLNTTTPHRGLYCVGWIKRGPVGVILSTIPDSKETASVVLEDLQNIVFQDADRKQGLTAIRQLLDQRNVRYVTFHDWERIDVWEKSQGNKFGKPREKLLSVQDMMKAAFEDIAGHYQKHRKDDEK